MPLNVIGIWTGANNGWPAGWSRETSLDARYVKCIPNTSTAGGVQGGALTHTHGQANHSHTGSGAHSNHSVTTGGPSNWSLSASSTGSSASGGGHGHTVSIGSGSEGNVSSGGGTGFDAQNNAPTYFEVIFIKSDGTPAGFPNLSVALWFTSALPSGWRLCDGTAGAPAMSSRYLKGAAAAGAGGGTGGVNTHTHAENQHSNHSVTSTHNHQILGMGAGDSVLIANAGVSACSGGHSHSFSGSIDFGGSGNTGNASATGTTSSDSGESAYRTALYVQNNSGSVSAPSNIIAIYLGSIASIPVGWSLCDGGGGRPNLSQGEYLKGGANTSDFNGTGGAATHNHGASGGISHNHGYGSHSHGSPGGSTSTVSADTTTASGSVFGVAFSHSHAMNGGGPAGAGSVNATTSDGAQFQSMEPVNTTVAFITNLVGDSGLLMASD